MDGEGAIMIALDERVFEEGGDGFVQQEWVFGDAGKRRIELRCALSKDLFRNTVGIEKGAEIQHIDGDRVGLTNAFEGAGPDASNRVGMIGQRQTSSR